ncbi:hypothetical protein TNCV_3938151 [Trichonephila clavipes]|nr:hypothetical protein TNCV_3938151 [Trichonephila clavipes]
MDERGLTRVEVADEMKVVSGGNTPLSSRDFCVLKKTKIWSISWEGLGGWSKCWVEWFFRFREYERRSSVHTGDGFFTHEVKRELSQSL